MELNPNLLIEILAALSGVWAVWLNTRRNLGGWVVGLVSIVLTFYTMYSAKLYGEAGLQIIYAAMTLYGLYQWWQKRNPNLTIPPLSAPLNLHGIGIGITGVLTGLLGYFMDHYTDAPVPYLDASLTAASLFANYLLAKRYAENWLWWIVIDLACAVLFYSRGLPVFAGLFVVYTLLAVQGWFSWKKQMGSLPEPV